MKRLVIIPRWAGGPEKDFYPWLRRSLAERSPLLFDEILSPEMPDPSTPTIAAWTSRIAEIVGDNPGNTTLLGHSVGCQAVLRYLAELPRGAKVRGALLVAGWFGVDKPWETIRPWMDTPLDFTAVRESCPRLMVLLSDNDPFTADFAETGRAFEERLGAEVRLVPGAKHFNAAEEPSVLEALEMHFT